MRPDIVSSKIVAPEIQGKKRSKCAKKSSESFFLSEVYCTIILSLRIFVDKVDSVRVRYPARSSSHSRVGFFLTNC